nr:immunoglobulin light chain junction region [Macaca mulatta]MOV78672.1 immunoglobulin light chain junction region [Macaca mulatta]MOV78897.1 immunoglobulin light chain junction region [Macaca mulatta]MOV80001.1 immunoglobulin light chain junction region [Macaca mulatta]MOV80188.1 immunoglobulin light chain junction region [Macaca mulatta]
CQQDYHWPPTF